MSAPAIRFRVANHLVSFKNNAKRNQTELSKQIHALKDKGIDHNINFRVVEMKKPYCNISKKCQLCTSESYNILFGKHPNIINKKSEIISKCRHRARFKLNCK